MATKVYLLIVLTTFSGLPLFGQSDDIWTVFWDKDRKLIGYKDKNDVVKIAPKFTGFTSARKFENIIAVSEKIDDRWVNYYLTKHGSKVGIDSLFTLNNAGDCESEGFIRFRDPKTNKVGLFNKNGNIAIPAIYDGLTSVRNGMAIAVDSGKKTHGADGQTFLIDTNNHILIDNFKLAYYRLNYFSLEVTDAPHPDTTRKSFPARDGSYYSFIDFEKEFREWLTTTLSTDFSLENLIGISHDTITWWSDDRWVKTAKENLITDNFDMLKSGLLEVLQPETQFFISKPGLNPYTFNGAEFEKYFDNCGESKEWIYPTMDIIISYRVGDNVLQNHYLFLRTDVGYKLLRLSMKHKK